MRDVLPLRGRSALAPANPPPPETGPPAKDGAARQTPGIGIDRANAERLKRGRWPIDARLDLHGKTQEEAHRALVAFVPRARDAGHRCVLVITGRGLGPSGPGVLKTAVPRWLAEPELARHVLMTAAAQPRDGGGGALYLLLRRQRQPQPSLRRKHR